MIDKQDERHSADECPNAGRSHTRKIIEEAVSRLLTDLSVWSAASAKDGDAESVALAKQFTGALTGRMPREYMPPVAWHDAIDRRNALNAVLAAAGLDPRTWGLCPLCDRLPESMTAAEAVPS